MALTHRDPHTSWSSWPWQALPRDQHTRETPLGWTVSQGPVHPDPADVVSSGNRVLSGATDPGWVLPEQEEP